MLTDEERLENDVRESQKEPLHCSLCDKETYGRGVYTATEMGTLGAPVDAYRVIIYPLCEKCTYTIGFKEEIKRRILREYN